MELDNDSDSDPDKCFICYNEGGLSYIKVCCGTLITHSNCFSDYCSHTQSCPICHMDITIKLSMIKKYSLSWDKCKHSMNKCIQFCQNMFKKYSGVCSFIVYICGLKLGGNMYMNRWNINSRKDWLYFSVIPLFVNKFCGSCITLCISKIEQNLSEYVCIICNLFNMIIFLFPLGYYVIEFLLNYYQPQNITGLALSKSYMNNMYTIINCFGIFVNIMICVLIYGEIIALYILSSKIEKIEINKKIINACKKMINNIWLYLQENEWRAVKYHFQIKDTYVLHKNILDDKIKCFRCKFEPFNDTNVHSAKICCSTLYYHDKCFDLHCNNTVQPIRATCPVCIEDVSKKVIKDTSYIINWNKFLKYILNIYSMMTPLDIYIGTLLVDMYLYSCRWKEKCNIFIDWIGFFFSPLIFIALVGPKFELAPYKLPFNTYMKMLLLLPSIVCTIITQISLIIIIMSPFIYLIGEIICICTYDVFYKYYLTYENMWYIYICITWIGPIAHVINNAYYLVYSRSHLDHHAIMLNHLNNIWKLTKDFGLKIHTFTHSCSTKYEIKNKYTESKKKKNK
mgnify:CR=1 FL=1